MPIHLYRFGPNLLYTNQGQTTVEQFMDKLQAASKSLLSTKPLTVLVGYHGDTNGEFAVAFDKGEIEAVKGAAKNFKDATLVWYDAKKNGKNGFSVEEIKKAATGNVLYTWCDSDTRLKKLLPVLAKQKPAQSFKGKLE